jgi:5'-phosphate synthase pdxT subunit
VRPRLVGVLALQGAFAAHQRLLGDLGVATRQVRNVADLDEIDALVLPGGESTTMSKLLVSTGLLEPIRSRLADGLPALGTCAGMILLAAEVLDGRIDQQCLGAIDISVRRNGYGRQLDSFECDLEIAADGFVGGVQDSFHGVFIRAPKVHTWADSVQVLASHQGVPVLLRQRGVTVASFHPELTGDSRIHAMFIDHLVTEAS